ncbi:MAG TPA: signal peptidase II [Candidatus Methylacidiphilales bacterium]
MQSRWPRLLFYLVTIGVLVVDQLTKAWASASLRPVETVTLIPGFFNLTYVRNTGIAFGMFAGQGLLVALFMIVLGGVALYYTRGLNWAVREPNVIGGFLIGGAIGNLADRSRLGYVVDFFDVHLGDSPALHWPVFNVADSMICIAVGWIVLRQLWPR